MNIKLASRLVGLEIDVFRDTEEEGIDEDDVELSEFSDVIDSWIIDELNKIGLDTARSVLVISKEDLVLTQLFPWLHDADEFPVP